MIIVTGGAGLIGSNVVWKLNERGISDLLIVDENAHGSKDGNLKPLRYSHYVDKDEFIKPLLEDSCDEIEAILHFGACSNTTETDKDYLYRNNFDYTRKLAVHFLYLPRKRRHYRSCRRSSRVIHG